MFYSGKSMLKFSCPNAQGRCPFLIAFYTASTSAISSTMCSTLMILSNFEGFKFSIKIITKNSNLSRTDPWTSDLYLHFVQSYNSTKYVHLFINIESCVFHREGGQIMWKGGRKGGKEDTERNKIY